MIADYVQKLRQLRKIFFRLLSPVVLKKKSPVMEYDSLASLMLSFVQENNLKPIRFNRVQSKGWIMHSVVLNLILFLL